VSDQPNLLHNMSSPPRTVVRYGGLSGLETSRHPEASGVAGNGCTHEDIFGSFVAFRLPGDMRKWTAAPMLEYLEIEMGENAEKTLIGLIEHRATELPLPGGCMVKPCENSHPSPWPDMLAALTIITKSSANVWLRSKTPALSRIRNYRSVSLLLPPAVAISVLEAPQ
jgi:hypothetical protein